MLKRDNFIQNKVSQKDKELERQILLAKKTKNAKLSCFSLKAWPK